MEYSFVCKKDSVTGYTYIGEEAMETETSFKFNFTNIPFYIFNSPATYTEIMYVFCGASDSYNSYKITAVEELVRKLDKKYLPEGIATETYVDEIIPAWAKEPNKPTYTATEVDADPAGTAASALAEAKTYAEAKAAEVVNSAPETLNTLNELATALGNDPNFATTVATQIGTKANSADLTSHTTNKSNPHGVTAAQLGITSETWTFTLDNGTTVTKKVAILS